MLYKLNLMAHKTVFLLPLILAGLLFAGCSFKDHQLKEGWWKYGEGYSVGDVIDFKAGYTLSQDTLLMNGRKVAIVSRIDKRIFPGNNQMIIRSLDGRQSGVYFQK